MQGHHIPAKPYHLLDFIGQLELLIERVVAGCLNGQHSIDKTLDIKVVRPGFFDLSQKICNICLTFFYGQYKDSDIRLGLAFAGSR